MTHLGYAVRLVREFFVAFPEAGPAPVQSFREYDSGIRVPKKHGN
jgi:hypothetical protein